ncbi:hypothetical protein D918_03626 [Trichuris suis]|nr:hypothetical protein D918_03626 [Trichuris suis]
MAVEALLPASAVAKMNGNCTGLVSADGAVLIDVGENGDSVAAKKYPKEPKKFLQPSPVRRVAKANVISEGARRNQH